MTSRLWHHCPGVVRAIKLEGQQTDFSTHRASSAVVAPGARVHHSGCGGKSCPHAMHGGKCLQLCCPRALRTLPVLRPCPRVGARPTGRSGSARRHYAEQNVPFNAASQPHGVAAPGHRGRVDPITCYCPLRCASPANCSGWHSLREGVLFCPLAYCNPGDDLLPRSANLLRCNGSQPPSAPQVG